MSNVEKLDDADDSEKDILENLHTCGYCGSHRPYVPYTQMYGSGAVGWDCCPDCGGV